MYQYLCLVHKRENKPHNEHEPRRAMHMLYQERANNESEGCLLICHAGGLVFQNIRICRSQREGGVRADRKSEYIKTIRHLQNTLRRGQSISSHFFYVLIEKFGAESLKKGYVRRGDARCRPLAHSV